MSRPETRSGATQNNEVPSSSEKQVNTEPREYDRRALDSAERTLKVNLDGDKQLQALQLVGAATDSPGRLVSRENGPRKL